MATSAKPPKTFAKANTLWWASNKIDGSEAVKITSDMLKPQSTWVICVEFAGRAGECIDLACESLLELMRVFKPEWDCYNYAFSFSLTVNVDGHNITTDADDGRVLFDRINSMKYTQCSPELRCIGSLEISILANRPRTWTVNLSQIEDDDYTLMTDDVSLIDGSIPYDG